MRLRLFVSNDNILSIANGLEGVCALNLPQEITGGEDIVLPILIDDTVADYDYVYTLFKIASLEIKDDNKHSHLEFASILSESYNICRDEHKLDIFDTIEECCVYLSGIRTALEVCIECRKPMEVVDDYFIQYKNFSQFKRYYVHAYNCKPPEKFDSMLIGVNIQANEYSVSEYIDHRKLSFDECSDEIFNTVKGSKRAIKSIIRNTYIKNPNYEMPEEIMLAMRKRPLMLVTIAHTFNVNLSQRDIEIINHEFESAAFYSLYISGKPMPDDTYKKRNLALNICTLYNNKFRNK